MMPRSISASRVTERPVAESLMSCNPFRPVAQAGFTLFEVLVVAFLLGLLGFVTVSTVSSGGEQRQLQQATVNVPDLLTDVAEQSMFLGQMLAIRLHENRLEPLRYDPQSLRFVELGAGIPGAPKALQLHESLRLEWQATEIEQGDRPDAPMDLGAVIEERLLVDDTDSDEIPPQIFFFPSGEATPMRLTLSVPQMPELAAREIELDTLGRARLREDTL